MYKLLLTIAFAAAMVVVAAQKANAVEIVGLKNFKTSKTGVAPNVTKTEVAALWASNKPACIKDGSKVLAVNKAFASANLGSRDCSSGAKTLAKHKKLGLKVWVIQAYQLPSEMLKR